MQIISKADAKAAGLPRYFTGIPCRNGHISERRTHKGACLECRRNASREEKRRRRKEPGYLQIDQQRTREWRASSAGKAWTAEYTKARWAAKRDDEEFRQTQRRSMRKWRAENLDKKSAMDAAWRAANKDSAEFKEKQRVRVLNRIAQKRAAPGRYTVADISTLYERQGGLCACGCGRDIAERRYHIDHKTPLSKGGSNWPDNIQLLSPACNLAKANRTMEEWRSAQAEFSGATTSL